MQLHLIVVVWDHPTWAGEWVAQLEIWQVIKCRIIFFKKMVRNWSARRLNACSNYGEDRAPWSLLFCRMHPPTALDSEKMGLKGPCFDTIKLIRQLDITSWQKHIVSNVVKLTSWNGELRSRWLFAVAGRVRGLVWCFGVVYHRTARHQNLKLFACKTRLWNRQYLKYFLSILVQLF